MTLSTQQPKQNSEITQANRIKKLPPLLVNQLAAGEVVTRPASVVKELMENAIDAGASEITIRITQGGMGLIEVRDNGCGIHADDMVMAVTRFATSKIADVENLQGIATLGFRGEALAATAAVSRLTLKSSSNDSGIGRELTVAGILEDTPELTPVVHPQGTTVIVKDLYFNVPARRGNLKSISTEFVHIEAVVKQLALAASDIDISLWHNDKRRFHFEAVNTSNNQNYATAYTNKQNSPVASSAFQTALARLQAILPTSSLSHNFSSSDNQGFIEKQILPVTISLDGLLSDSAQFQSLSESNPEALSSPTNSFSISGFLMPSLSPSSTSIFKLIYINGRLVKDRKIAQKLRECANNFELDDLGYVLFFELPKVWLNLNVHPAKQCIKIQNLANVTAHLDVGVKGALQSWYEQLDKYVKSSQHQAPNEFSTSDNPTSFYDIEQVNSAQKYNVVHQSFSNNQQSVTNQNLTSQKGATLSNNDAVVTNTSIASLNAESEKLTVAERSKNYLVANDELVSHQGSINLKLNKTTNATHNFTSMQVDLSTNLQSQQQVQSANLHSSQIINCFAIIDINHFEQDTIVNKNLVLESLLADECLQNDVMILVKCADSILLISELKLLTFLEIQDSEYATYNKYKKRQHLNHGLQMKLNASNELSVFCSLLDKMAINQLSEKDLVVLMLQQAFTQKCSR